MSYGKSFSSCSFRFSNVPLVFRFSMSGNDTTFENFFVKHDLKTLRGFPMDVKVLT